MTADEAVKPSRSQTEGIGVGAILSPAVAQRIASAYQGEEAAISSPWHQRAVLGVGILSSPLELGDGKEELGKGLSLHE